MFDGKTMTNSMLTFAVAMILVLGPGPSALSYDIDEGERAASAQMPARSSNPGLRTAPNWVEWLFMGTCRNENHPQATANDTYGVDPYDSDPAPKKVAPITLLTGVQIWGATADVPNERALYTTSSGLPPPAGLIGGGDELFELSFHGGVPVSLGRILDGAGDAVRIDGLAMSGGVLYGTNAASGAVNGLYSIDLVTLRATPVALFGDSISGIDADPDTGVIYGSNDTLGQIVVIDPDDGSITPIADYPDELTDIDGLAAGNAYIFLVPDEPGVIPVFDLKSGRYITPLNSPFTAADTFSGAAYAFTGANFIFRNGFESGDLSGWSQSSP